MSCPHTRTNRPVLHRGRRRRARGTILIVVLLIIVALGGMVLVLGRTARVEAMSSANHVAAAQAAAVERAAEQYVMALVAQQRTTMHTLDESYFEAIPVGEAGAFWVVRPDYGDPELPAFGVVDEGSKINLNNSNPETLLALNIVPEELAYSIADWRDPDSEISANGAEDEYYQSLSSPYRCKNGAFEAVEELLLVKGAYPELLYGTRDESERLAATGASSGFGSGISSSAGGDEMLARGLFDYLTVYSIAPAEQTGGGGGGGGGGNAQRRIGRININTAPREVLLCLPGLTESDVDALIARRGSINSSSGSGTGGTGTGGSGAGTDATNTDWVNEVLGAKAGPVQPLIMGQSYQFSAEIVAASADGRAFRRARVVIDALDEANPKVIYRVDQTDRGWPLDPAILTSLRAGERLTGGRIGG
jgi:type II secretory pathway component PulK